VGIRVEAYSPDQARDPDGKWAGGGYGTLPYTLDPEDAKWIHDPSWKQHHDYRQQAYGGVIVRKDGRFLLREPTNHFDGYHWTWPKGKMESPEEHPVDVATREVREETGFNTRIFDTVPGTYKSATGSYSNFYLMKPKGFDRDAMDTETQGLRWATYAEAKQLIGRSRNLAGRWRDLKILERAHQTLKSYNYGKIQAYSPDEPRDPAGKWTNGPGGGAGEAKTKGAGVKTKVHEFLTGLGFQKLEGKHTFEGLKGKTGTGYEHPGIGKVVVESKAVSFEHPQGGTFSKIPVNTPAGMAKMQNVFAPTKTPVAMPSWWKGDPVSWESYKTAVAAHQGQPPPAKQQIPTSGLERAGLIAPEKLPPSLAKPVPAGMVEQYQSVSGAKLTWRPDVGAY
jgi:8-oxo-dGTP diphosphatase